MFGRTNHEVYAVTARAGDATSVQIATWVVPGSLVPDAPRAVLVLSPLNFTHTLIRQTDRLVLHLLADGQLEWLPRFGLSSTRDGDKLAGLALSATRSGLPVLPGTCGWAEFRVVDRLDAGDRIVHLCDALEIGVEPDDRAPLRLKDALGCLPAEVATALSDKRLRDGRRDAPWRKDYGTPAPLVTRPV